MEVEGAERIAQPVFSFEEQSKLARNARTKPLINAAQRRKAYRPFKRAIDRIGAALLLLLLSPLFLVIALAVRLTSPGPAIFRQVRLTRGGRQFTMYKFRSMRADAEKGCGAVWASAGDPRVTPIGKFLRKTRLDELPQLVNVVRGEMSFIGPRPERPELVQSLEEQLPSFRRRLEVDAGLSGLAQVDAGYCSTIEEYRKKLALDLLYVKKQCLLLDLRIAMRTVVILVTGHGAR